MTDDMCYEGDKGWLRVVAKPDTHGGGLTWTDDDDVPVDVIPDSPALPHVARLMAEDAEAFAELIDAAVFCLETGGEIIFDDQVRQKHVIAKGRAIIAALESGGEG